MNPKIAALEPALYFVATPIGSARDITLRALDILASVDVLAAEDTRSLRRLMEIHGVALGARKIISYHDHSSETVRKRLSDAVAAGKSVAYASEAGMPLVADPGFELGRLVAADGHKVTVAPGASAPLAALAISGLASDAFFFGGFLPTATSARKTRLVELRDIPGTLIFFESARRVGAMLTDATEVLGAERQAALCREITKKFEEVQRGSLAEIVQTVRDVPIKGEVVVLIARGSLEKISDSDLETELLATLRDWSVKDAVDKLSRAHGLPRRKVYQLALKLTKDRG